MITEAIDRILDLSKVSHRLLTAPDFRTSGKYYLLDSDGNLEAQWAAVPETDSTHFSTDSLVEALRQDAADRAVDPGDEELPVRIYYSRSGVYAYSQDHKDRRWERNLPLYWHPVFSVLSSLTETRALSQRALIRFLRAELNGHVADEIVEQFRELKLAASVDGTSVVAKGREGVDRSIQREVRQAAGADIPDSITVHVPVYDLDELREHTEPVELLVDVAQDDSGAAVFEITTVTNSLREAEFNALNRIRDALQAHLWAGAVLLHGKPA